MSQIMRLFRLLHVLCRRPLMVAALNNSLSVLLASDATGQHPERVDEDRQFLTRFELSRHSYPWSSGHDAQSRLCQDNFLRDGSRAESLGAGGATHRAPAHESGVPVLIRTGGSATRGGISTSAPHVPAANPLIPVPIRCFFSTKLLRISAGRKPSGLYRGRSSNPGSFEANDRGPRA